MAHRRMCGRLLVLVVASLALQACSAAPKPSGWQLCDKTANYAISVKDVSISPDPVISGEDATFIVPAYTDKEITGGSVVVTVSFHGIPVHTEHDDLCNKAECPIAPGDFVLKNTEVLPGLTPPGAYKIKLQFMSEADEQLACANIDFSIIWKRSVKDYNPIKMHKHNRQAHLAHV